MQGIDGKAAGGVNRWGSVGGSAMCGVLGALLYCPGALSAPFAPDVTQKLQARQGDHRHVYAPGSCRWR